MHTFLRSRLVAILTLPISQPPMSSTIFRHFQHKKKHLVSTTFTLPYYTPALKKTQNHTKAEEVILEPTPPLKCIHKPPSIKVPFPQNQGKSSSCKFTTKSIKTYTSQYNKNMIHNLSDHTLIDYKFSVLTKGLSLFPSPPKPLNKK